MVSRYTFPRLCPKKLNFVRVFRQDISGSLVFGQPLSDRNQNQVLRILFADWLLSGRACLPSDGCVKLRRNLAVINVAEISNFKGFFQRNSQKQIVKVAAFGAKYLKVVLRHLGGRSSSLQDCAQAVLYHGSSPVTITKKLYKARPLVPG